MKRKFTVTLLLLTSMVIAGAPLWAHHGNSAYDTNHPITLKGTVTEFAWTNPHVQIYFDVKNDKGEIVHWSCETFSPGKLVRSGWSKTAVKPGDQITVTLLPSKAGKPVGFLRKIQVAGGQELGLDEMPKY